MRLYRPTYKDKNGASRHSKRWWIKITDHNDVLRLFPGYTDKGATQDLAQRIKGLIACRANRERPDGDLARWLEGVPPKLKEKLSRFDILDARRIAATQSITDHLAEFYESILANGSSEQQAGQVKSRVKRVFDDCGFDTWTFIDAGVIHRYLYRRRQKERKHGGISVRTSNHYLQAVKAFGKWMVQNGRANSSPVDHLTALEVKKHDMEHPRRALEVEQARRLLHAASNSTTVRFGLDGAHRSCIYQIALETGLRWSEIRGLRKQDIDLKAGTIIVRSENAKNDKEATIPLRPDTVRMLQDSLSNKLPSAKVFTMPPADKAVRMLKPDLKAAGIPYEDEVGRFADFHALRHTCGTFLAASGVHPKVAATILRHSKVELTMNLYTHTLSGQEAQAVSSLPDLRQLPQEQQVQATGTDDVMSTGFEAVTKTRYAASDLCANLSTSGGQPLANTDISGQLSPPTGTPGVHKKNACTRSRTAKTGEKRRGRDSNPRYKLKPVRRFSKPLP